MLDDLTQEEINLLHYLLRNDIHLTHSNAWDIDVAFDIPVANSPAAFCLLKRGLIGSVCEMGYYILECTTNQYMSIELQQELCEYEIIWKANH